jgi:hypothetical protein
MTDSAEVSATSKKHARIADLVVELLYASGRLSTAVSGYLCAEMLPIETFSKEGKPDKLCESSVKAIKETVDVVGKSLDKILEMVEKES